MKDETHSKISKIDEIRKHYYEEGKMRANKLKGILYPQTITRQTSMKSLNRLQKCSPSTKDVDTPFTKE
jgi:hypothetical protein